MLNKPWIKYFLQIFMTKRKWVSVQKIQRRDAILGKQRGIFKLL